MNEKIKLITDSCCDIPPEVAEEYGIEILSFPITVDGKEYRERIDFSADEFYTMLSQTMKIPTHAQLIPIEFEDVYEKLTPKAIQILFTFPLTPRDPIPISILK